MLLCVYAGASLVLYQKLAHIDTAEMTNSPAEFSIESKFWESEESSYFVEEYRSVSFTPRGEDGMLYGWWLSQPDSDKAVIVVHGLESNKSDAKPLLTANLLAYAGYNVLIFDIREHGESFIEDRYTALGTDEYRDVLGAWDFVVSEGFDPDKIGFVAGSLGAVTTLLAAGEESEIQSLFLDASFSDHAQVIKEELTNKGYPSGLLWGGVVMARLLSGDSLLGMPIKEAIQRSKLEHVLLTHRSQDERVAFHHSEQLEAWMLKKGVDVEFWKLEGTGHVVTVFESPKLYQEKMKQFFEKSLSDD